MKNTQNILIVDDDKAHRTMLITLLKQWGYIVNEANDGDVAITMTEKQPFDLILMDVKMIKLSGIEALKFIKKINPAIPIIIMTAYSSVETAVDAIKNGAYDYLTKPFDFEKLHLTMKRAMDHTNLKKENQMLRQNLSDKFNFNNIIGRSNAMKKLMETVAQVAPTDATVLITGESGTGKELIAGAIHYNSLRKDLPFVTINCAAVTETLLESELFGHVKGAFTGANQTREGKFKKAHTGSLFLDEIGEMPLSMQVKLLRVLQERQITPVGSDKTINVDVRLIAATNRDIIKEVEQKNFRQDLFYRINVITLEIPPLRNRKDDIPLLAQHFLDKFSKKNNKNIKGFTPQAMDTFMKYSWPGNVRELVNTVERGVILSQSQYIDNDQIVLVQNNNSDITEFTNENSEDVKDINQNEDISHVSLDQIEKNAILKTLNDSDGNKSEAARRLKITRKTLHKKLKNYGIMGL